MDSIDAEDLHGIFSLKKIARIFVIKALKALKKH